MDYDHPEKARMQSAKLISSVKILRGRMMLGRDQWECTAAVCSFFIPGLGQLVQGRLLPHSVFVIMCRIFFAVLIIPAIMVDFSSMVNHDAARFNGPS